MKIKEDELASLLDEVASDLAKAWKAEKASLSKSLSKADGEPPEAEEEEGSQSKAPDAGPAEPPAPAASPADEGSAGGPGAAAGPAAGPEASSPAPDMGAGDPAQDQALTPEALQAEYSKLQPEELDMHIQAALAAKQAIAAPAGPDMGMGQPPMGPGAGPSAPPAGPVGPGPSAAMKSEVAASGYNKASGGQINKSEAAYKETLKKYESRFTEMEALIKSQSAALKSNQEDIENLAEATKRVIEQPLRKAITNVAQISKTMEAPKEITAASIHARLKDLSATPSLKKSDRNLINDFYDKRVSIDKLSHLFENK